MHIQPCCLELAWLPCVVLTTAFLAAVPLVLGEAYVIIMFIGKNFLFGQLTTDLFDAVMVQKGHAALVEKHRAVTTRSTGGRQLGRVLTRPLSKLSTDNIVRYLLTLPLNLIPVVGTVFFLGYNGKSQVKRSLGHATPSKDGVFLVWEVKPS